MNMLNPKNRKKTMKTFRLFSMAALALAMAACSNEDSALENAAPAQQQGAMKFTATLAAPGSGATTRTTYTEVTEGDDAGKINVAWKAGDQISLYDLENGAVCIATVGTPAASGSATISGTFDYDVEAGENIIATYPVSAAEDLAAFNAKFASQAGTPAYIQDNLDYRIGTSTISVDGDQATLATALKMESQIAIWKLTLQDNAATPAALSATKVTIKNGSTVIAATTDITATSAVYLALNLKSGNISGADITIEATVGSDTYTYSKSGVSLAKGKYYQSTVKMAKAATNLSTISSDYEVKNGEVLTGTLGENVKISVADGATVTLKDVTINGNNNSSYDWAGITCVGSATIILEGENTVKGFYENNPGIYVPEGKTLTIMGSGKLTASSNDYGAGIGGGYYISCGNIVINSGTINATGGVYAAGIGGGGFASCGNITISGGTITAMSYGYGAGIGGGGYASCGNITISGGTVTATGVETSAGIGGGEQNEACGTITITSGVTKVKATAGDMAPCSIGMGDNGTAISVTIGGTEYASGITTSPYEYTPAP